MSPSRLASALTSFEDVAAQVEEQKKKFASTTPKKTAKKDSRMTTRSSPRNGIIFKMSNKVASYGKRRKCLTATSAIGCRALRAPRRSRHTYLRALSARSGDGGVVGCYDGLFTRSRSALHADVSPRLSQTTSARPTWSLGSTTFSRTCCRMPMSVRRRSRAPPLEPSSQ